MAKKIPEPNNDTDGASEATSSTSRNSSNIAHVPQGGACARYSLENEDDEFIAKSRVGKCRPARPGSGQVTGQVTGQVGSKGRPEF